MKRSLELVGLGLFICLAPGGLARGQVAINVSPSLPSDIAGGASAATLQQAAATQSAALTLATRISVRSLRPK
jgi:hypothetical protein